MKAIRFLNTAEKLKDSTPEEDARTLFWCRHFNALGSVTLKMERERGP